ncbi:MAG: hypothetical protein QW472_03460 [Candidatus Aenigmatarchaeota archaeon]
MEIISKNFNKISKGLSSIILTFLFLMAITLILINMPNISAQVTNQTIMNASISQVIGIVLSNELAEGIFFTNKTTIGVQYPITDMTVWNNATRNYNGTPPYYNTTLYWINASSSNKVNITICHCACDHLNCSNTTECGNSFLNITGVGWSNSTYNNATHPQYPPLFNFTAPDTFQSITVNLPPGLGVYLRYWIDPQPDNVPSGRYNTTYLFKAVEVSQNCGTCTC